MSSTLAAPASGNPAIRSAFMVRIFYAFAGLAAVSVLISAGGHWLGAYIARSGHSDDRTTYEIVIGNDVLVAPANEIRFDRQRRNGVAHRVDLYLRWPQMDGYSEAARDDFNHVGGESRILFLSIEPRMMSRDMSGRLAPIYSSLIEYPGSAMTGGLLVHDFKKASGYLNEALVVAPRDGEMPFVARCLTGVSAADSLAPCERDIQIGTDLSLSYRFPQEFLSQWREMEDAVRIKAARLIRTAN